MLFPHAAEAAARAEWQRRYGTPWPLGQVAGPRFGRSPTVDEAAEADELFVAATLQQPFSGVTPRSPMLRSKAEIVKAVVGEPSVPGWKGDWALWRFQVPPAPPPEHEPALLSVADAVAAAADRLPAPTGILPSAGNPYVTVSGGGWTSGDPPMGGRSPFSDSRGPVWDNIGGVAEIIKRYMGIVPPDIELANQIRFRNYLIKEGWTAKQLRSMNIEIGRMARDLKHYWGDRQQL
ncbi:MAG: hypothetical protein HOV79_32260 [Hamadaea sp.]|nr:hypothetical protein [Hamadaea sp.]